MGYWALQSLCLCLSLSFFLRQLQQRPLVNPREDLWSWNFSELRWIWLFHPSSCREGAPGKRADLGFYSSLQLQAIPGRERLSCELSVANTASAGGWGRGWGRRGPQHPSQCTHVVIYVKWYMSVHTYAGESLIIVLGVMGAGAGGCSHL